MCEWQRLRSSLNHDWLKNEYLKNLDGLIVQIQASRSLNARMESDLRAYLSEWKGKHAEMDNLLNSAENILSPRSLFEREPLIHCSQEIKAWIAPLIHGLWLMRHRVREKVNATRRLLSKADQSHGLLEAKFEMCGTPDVITETLETFTDTVKRLSRLLSSFPDEVVTL